MGHRLSKIYTRTGDAGTTGLGDGSRTSKASGRIEVMGEVDELNCLIGLLRTHALPAPIAETLLAIQHDLFDLGGELAIPGTQLVGPAYIERIEHAIDHLNAALPPLKEFILPGGSAAAAVCHLARAVARRCERALVRAQPECAVNGDALAYVNRLSDYLFVAARTLARAQGGQEVMWDRSRVSASP